MIWSGLIVAALMCFQIGQIISQPPDFAIDEELVIGKTPMDLVFVIDTSTFGNTSKSLEDERNIKAFFTTFIESAEIDSGAVKVALVTYSTHPKLEFGFNKYSTKGDVQNAILAADFIEGERNTADTLSLIRSQVLARDRPEAVNVVLLLQTGKSNVNEQRIIQEAEALKYAGTTVFVVGYGLDSDAKEEVNEIVSRPVLDNAFTVTSVEELDIIRDVVFSQIFTRAEQAYKSPTAGSEQLDLIFLIHFSFKIKRDEHQQILNFMNGLLEHADIDGGDVRVGAVLYRKQPTVLFNLSSYETKNEILSAINQIPYTYRAKAANVASGFDAIRKSLLTDAAGDRRNAPNLVVVITDDNADEDTLQTITAAEELKSSGTAVYTVGINVANPEELYGITSSREYTIIVNDTRYLADKLKQFRSTFLAMKDESMDTTSSILERTTVTLGKAEPLVAFQIEKALENQEEADVVIAFHVSENVDVAIIKKYLFEFINDAIASMDIDSGAVRLSIVVFGPSTDVQFKLNKFQQADKLKTAVKNQLKAKDIKTKDGDVANLLNVLRTDVFTEKQGDRPKSPNALILITDKGFSSKINDIAAETAALKRSDTAVFAIGIQGADSKEIETLASDPVHEYSYMGKSYSDLTQSLELREKLQQRFKMFKNLELPKSGPTKKPTPPSRSTAKITSRMTVSKDKTPTKPILSTMITTPERTTTRAVPVSSTKTTTSIPKITVPINTTSRITIRAGTTTDIVQTPKATTRSSITTAPVKTTTTQTIIYLPSPLPLAESEKADIVFALHMSPRASTSDFATVKEFIKGLISNANVESGKVQVGIMSYAEDSVVIFNVNRYQSLIEMLKEIDGIGLDIRSSNADASGALTLGGHMLSETYAQGMDVPAAIIFITDQSSNVNEDLLQSERQTIVDAGIKIFAVGIGMKDTKELEMLASPAENVMSVSAYAKLNDASRDIREKIRAFRTRSMDQTPPGPVATLPTYTGEDPILLTLPAVVTVQPKTPGCSLGNSDLVIIMDASTSVTEVNYKKMLEFVKKLLANADIDSGAVRVGVVIYSSSVSIQFHLNRYNKKSDVLNAVDSIPYIYGSTNTADGLRTMREEMFTRSNGDRLDVPNTCIIITDGVSNINAKRTIPEAEAARAAGIHIYAIGIGLTETRELDAIASVPASENSFSIQNFDELVGLDEKIFAASCPVAPATTTVKPVECGLSKVDLVLIMDASTSVTEVNYKKMLSFANDIVDKADIDSGSVRVGALIYSSDVQVQFLLNQYRTKAEVKAAIDKIPYIYGSTNSADALKVMHETLFLEKNGDRPGVDNVAFMITDGVSNINARRTIPEAEAAQRKGIQIYAIGIGLSDTQELEGMASVPKKNYTFSVKAFDELKGLVDKIFGGKEACALDSPPRADAGSDVTIQLPVNYAVLDGRRSSDDKKIVRYQWIQTAGSTNMVKIGEDSAQLSLSNLNPGEYEFTLTVYDDTSKSHSDSVKVRVIGLDLPPTAVAGEDVTIQLPRNSVLLDGRGSSDDKSIVIYMWVVDSNDQSLILDGTNKSVLNVSGLQTGVYKFTLTVLDALAQADEDSVFVTVTAADSPPVARAGEDITIRQPANSVTLDGSKSSDDIEITRYRWRLTAGDKNKIEMGDDKLPQLKLTNMKPGIYRFSLTVVDKLDQRDIDNVTVTLLEDLPPTANAGPNINLELPDDSVTLSGDKSQDDYGINSYFWSLVLGDHAIVMDGRDGPNLMLGLLKEGLYRFQLTVTDSAGQNSTDTVDINVLPARKTTPALPTAQACGLNAVDLVFVVDASTSVTEVNFQKQLNFMKSIIDYADIDSGSVRVGALIYSTEVNIQFYLNTYKTKKEVLAAVDKIPYIYGSTNTADGLMTMRTELFSFRNGDRDDAPNTAIVITDGVSNINARRTIPEAVDARSLGIHIYAIGIGLTDTRELEAIASEPANENAFAVTDFDQLRGLETQIFSAICLEPSTTPTTTPQPTTTMRRTPVITTREAPRITTPSCGLSRTDLVLILDASTSVTDVNFQKMRDFVKDFLRNAGINSGALRVGIVIYSSEVQIIFHLNRYTTEDEVMAAVDGIPYTYGSTNTADALKVMRTEMFSTARGDRPDIRNIAILLTDGISNINSRRTIPEAEAARSEGIHIYVIGIALTDSTEVDAIATPPASQNRFSVQTFDELKALPARVFSSVCPNVTTTQAPKDNPPTANAGTDITIQLPTGDVTLSGDNSTDDVKIVQYEWTQISGPKVTLTQSDRPYLTLQNLKVGSYVMQLKVTDSKNQSSTDLVVVNVQAETDLPPTANAGSDKQVQLPENSVTLSGIQSTDDKGIVGYSWVLTSPRGKRVTMRGDNTDTLRVSDLTEGDYIFTLTVRDKNGQNNTDTVNVKVLAAQDRPPIANAGKNLTIQLPLDSVTLDGSKSSDDIAIVSYRWDITSGDSRGVRLTGQTSRSLGVSGLKEGGYVFTLTVTDRKDQKSSHSVGITVTPAARTTGYDVIFVLDSSVSPSYFRWMNNYARAIVREINIDNGEFRVGYVTYSNGAYRQFDLNEHETRASVLSGIDKVVYTPGDKNTAAALKYVRKQMFTAAKGDRDFAKNYVILLTGGNSSVDPFGASTEACQLQNDGVGMFANGFGEITDVSELNSYSSLPTSDYNTIINSEAQMGETPGLLLYNLKQGTPRARPCPTATTTTTQRPVGPIKCTAYGDVVFILDSSGSVGQENFYRVLNFTYETIDDLDIDSGNFRVGVVTFSDTSRLDFNLNEFKSKRDIEEAITKVTYMYGNTNTAHALQRARLEMFANSSGDRPDVQNVIVIITDGQSNVNHEQTIPEADSLKRAGISIITVAVGFTSETNELVGITSPPVTENLIYVEDYASLGKLKNKLVNPLCTDPDMCRTRPCQNGGQCMDGIRSFMCICPTGFYGDHCNKRCGEPVDVAIVLDSSSSVGEYNFGRLKEYSEHMIRAMNKDSCDINLGFIKYSSAPMMQVNLGTYRDTETNIRALERISFSPGRANMAAAFRSLRTEVFNGQRGDRPNARNIAYILTDGTNDVDAENTEPEAEQAISSGIRIIPIGINLREKYELENIAHNQGINIIEIGDEQAMMDNTDFILSPLHEGRDFCATNPCSNGGTCHNEPFGYRCDCMIGYTGETCQRRCSSKGDLVFAVDTSRYVTRKELKTIRRFLKSVTKRLQFEDGFNVGLVQFSDTAKVVLGFGENQLRRSLRSSIAGLRVQVGDPEPYQALAKANYRIFNGNEASKEKPDYLVLITKGTGDEEQLLFEANKLKIQGTRILTVGVGLTESERDYMESVVSMPYNETAIFADEVKSLDNIADKLVAYMCDAEDKCAENPCLNDGVCQRIGAEFYCDCGVGYAGRYCENKCDARADIIFLLDSSGSVGHVDFRRIKQFVHELVSDLQIGFDKTRVGLVTFSSVSRHGFYLNTYTSLYELQNAIAGISYEYGNTNTADGLRMVRERYFSGNNGDRSEIQNFLIVVTDGVSNVEPDQTLIEAKLIKEKGVHVYAVGVGDVDPYEINNIATAPASKNSFLINDFASLGNITSSIVKKTCRDPTVCDENPCRNGGVCVPGVNGPFCECRAGYLGEHCQESCVTVKDIFFLLDSSDTVGYDNFKTSLNFINSIVETFSSKDSFNRFSLITFSTEVQIVFSLGRYTTLPVLQNAIKYARYRPGKTNLAGALRTAKEISVADRGDRYDAENVVFLITDGNGDINEQDTMPAADTLKSSGARIISVAVKMNDTTTVEKVASSPQDVYIVQSFTELDSALEDIIKATCKNGNVIPQGK